MKKIENSGFFPVLVNLKRFKCLVIGGGKIAYRKVLSLLEFNADITVLSPKISNPLIDLSKQKKIKIIKKPYSKDFIKDYKIIFSATDNAEINETVHSDCARKGILLNVVDNPSLCDFILPANVKRGNLVVSVSSQGAAPFYVKEIKKKIDGFLPPVFEEITGLAGDFRKEILKNGKFKSAKNKTNAFKKFLATDWEEILLSEGRNTAQKYIRQILERIN